MYFAEDLWMFLPLLTTGIPSALLSVAAYVLTAFSLYAIARRRGLDKAWLAWVPVANSWIVGSLSDQYQYLVKGQNKSKRKVLLVLNILQTVFAATLAVLAAVMAAGAFFAMEDARMVPSVLGPAMAILGLCVPLMGVAIANIVIRYMAMFDIYRSADPENSILYLVLSILVSITEPFFLFFNRNKDGGMPPRKQAEASFVPPVQPEQENWAAEDYNYE